MRRLLVAGLMAIVVSFAVATSARAQSSTDPMIGVGYVAQGPHMFLGGTVWGLIPGLGGWGLYVDAKLGLDDRGEETGFEPGIEVSETDPTHLPLTTDTYWQSANVAVVRVLTDELTVYVGGGWSDKKAYKEFLDPSETLGQLGHYWVVDEGKSGADMNFMAGAFLRITPSVRAQFGGETRPTGFTVGVSIVFPGR
ncbi:MAG: hypothetical protein R6U63_06710 [Longimicrobiales bacterium]